MCVWGGGGGQEYYFWFPGGVNVFTFSLEGGGGGQAKFG